MDQVCKNSNIEKICPPSATLNASAFNLAVYMYILYQSIKLTPHMSYAFLPELHL